MRYAYKLRESGDTKLLPYLAFLQKKYFLSVQQLYAKEKFKSLKVGGRYLLKENEYDAAKKRWEQNDLPSFVRRTGNNKSKIFYVKGKYEYAKSKDNCYGEDYHYADEIKEIEILLSYNDFSMFSSTN